MRFSEQTDIGGTGQAFLTTHWSLIRGIQSTGDRDLALIGILLEKYWKPAYCYLVPVVERRFCHRRPYGSY
jgi:hypothetical protein